ncbi:hypothetical protein GCM10023165_45180 [Variovorax defluvii]|uniref:Uncharacterized protein n=1 Tax=Variovorax defluvii TaxID=913761 RepID=A0ABP8I9H7_9BURK
MEFSTLLGISNASWLDDVLLWTIVTVAGVLGLAVVVNALDAFFDAETG